MSKRKLNVLITRPDNAGRELEAYLKEQGIACYHQVFFDYQKRETLDDLAELRKKTTPAIIIFVSVAAVEFADKCLPLVMWQNYFGGNIEFIAVGKATAHALSQLAIDAIVPENQNSEGMLTLDKLQQVNNKNIIIVRGDGGREILAQTLRQRGANVYYFESYQRVWRQYSQNIFKTWQDQQINGILVTSRALLTAMMNVIPITEKKWLQQCICFVVSQRIADAAKQLGIEQVINIESANNLAIAKALKSFNLSSGY